MTYFEERAAATAEALKQLAESVEGHLALDRERILRGDTCIYVVGSGGRGEISKHSDVDLFVARNGRKPSEGGALLVRQAIARALFQSDRPDPSQGGGFLKMHTAKSLCEEMGTPADDAGNMFTARMLLLLESRPLVGADAYESLLRQVIAAYFSDEPGHEVDFQPFVLVNDTVRYWRILLLNYFAKNVEKERELDDPLVRDAERRLRSYKLRFSRCLTCFSFLAALVAETAHRGVTDEKILGIVRRTPVERLQAIRGDQPAEAHVTRLLSLYEQFLRRTDGDAKALREEFKDTSFRAQRGAEGREFGNEMFELLQVLGSKGRGKELFRHMVV